MSNENRYKPYGESHPDAVICTECSTRGNVVALYVRDTGEHDEQEHPECINANEDCAGRVEYRMPLSATGKPFPRCGKHWDDRLTLEGRLRRDYPTEQPADFDPSYAGESWYED